MNKNEKKRSGKSDVCLVLMPYVPVERPSIALGILKSCLAASGVSSRVVYANLKFADRVGLAPYNNILNGFRDFQNGEWTFSAGAFKDRGFNNDGYPDFIKKIIGDLSEKYLENLSTIKSEAEHFVEELADEIIGYSPKIVGCSSSFQQNCSSLALLRAVKKRRGDIVTMMGGANCEQEMGVSLVKLFPWVDFVVSGEPEEYFGDLCLKIIETGGKFKKSEIPYGVIGKINYREFTRSREGERPIKAPPRSFVKSLDTIPVPDYSDYFDALSEVSIRSKISPGLPFESSRGCWWGQKSQCTFCGLNGKVMGYRLKSPERAVSEFVENSERYDIKNIECIDNVIAPAYIDKFLKKLKKYGDYNIFCEVRPTLSRSQIFKLAGAGVKWVQPGIESLHDDVLKLMNKGVGALQNIEFLKFSREAGVRSSWNLLTGFPGESDEWYGEMADMLPLLYHLQPPNLMIRIFIDRFGGYQKNPEKFGLTVSPLKAYSYIYPFSPETLCDLVYYFEDVNSPHSKDPRIFTSPGRSALKAKVDYWIRSFWSARREMLGMSDDGSRFKVIDLRSCARRLTHTLAGVDYLVYKACATAEKEEKIFEFASGKEKFSIDDIRNSISRLIENKLLICIGRKYLALAINGMAPALPEIKDFPGGTSI